MGWTQIPGWAMDIAVGGDGSVFHSGHDGFIYKWNGSGWNYQTMQCSGPLTAGPNGEVFYFSPNNKLTYNGSEPIISGFFTSGRSPNDFGAGADGNLWGCMDDSHGSGFIGYIPPPYNGSPVMVPGIGWDISGGNGVNAWHIGRDRQLFRHDGQGHWLNVPATVAIDIAVTSTDVAWHIGQNGECYQRVGAWDTGQWVSIGGASTRVSVGPDNLPWTVNSAGEIWRYST